MYKPFLLILTTLQIGYSYLCFECTSLDEKWCTEHFIGKDMSAFAHHVVNCSRDCMKMIATVGDSKQFYVRTCDMTEGFPNTCFTGSHVLGIPTSTVCVCAGDRCNEAMTSFPEKYRSVLVKIGLVFIVSTQIFT